MQWNVTKPPAYQRVLAITGNDEIVVGKMLDGRLVTGTLRISEEWIRGWILLDEVLQEIDFPKDYYDAVEEYFSE